MTSPLIIIGSGLAAYSLARDWRRQDSETPLTIITAEDGDFYSKPLLSTALAKQKTLDELVIAKGAKQAQQFNAELLTQQSVKVLDTINQKIMLDDQTLVDSANQSSAGVFAQDVNWAESGWSDFSLYAPIFETAIQYSSPILAANPPKDQIMTSFMSEPEVLKGAKGLTSEELTELEAEIDTAHCGYSNEEMTKAMVIVQRFKDAWMARVVEDNIEDALVLVAGFGHTRIDRGVPWYFSSELAPDVLSIQFREVELEYDDPKKYGSDAHLVYFTPRVDSIDPCVKFKEQLENMGHSTH